MHQAEPDEQSPMFSCRYVGARHPGLLRQIAVDGAYELNLQCEKIARARGQYHCGHMYCGRVYPISNPSASKIGLRAQ
jgi:hypothetical protein